MSFTSEVKKEIIITSDYNFEQKKYVLFGLLSSILKVQNNIYEFTVKNIDIDNYSRDLFEEVYDNKIEECGNDFIQTLFRNYDDCQYMIPNIKLNNKMLLKNFLIGIYLGCGSLINPKNSYHLEMKTGSEKLSYFVINILDKFGISAKINFRKNTHYVYINDAENISDFLKLCGAINAIINFEELRIVKDMRNNVNRKVNCELANLNRVLETGLKQKNDILIIQEKVGLSSLPNKLYEVAVIRLEDEQLSFSEIGEMIIPKISKSTVCKRLKKISEIAEDLRGVQL